MKNVSSNAQLIYFLEGQNGKWNQPRKNHGKNNRSTVIQCKGKKKFAGIDAATITPMNESEHLLVEMCLACARIGYAQSNNKLVQIAKELIKCTTYDPG